jgi:hypothetical protein
MVASRHQSQQVETKQGRDFLRGAGVKQVVSEPTTEREDLRNENASLSPRPKVSRSRLSPPTILQTDSEPEREPRVRYTMENFAKDGIKPRVKKFKNASQSMIDEAAVDPTFRFLLVAALLFIFSVILLIISNVLR